MVDITSLRGKIENDGATDAGMLRAEEFNTLVKAVIEKGASTKSIAVSGVLAVAFDHDACGITNTDRRVTSNYNSKAEFTNYFYKVDAAYFNDLNENFIVFYVA